jgi:hypothetical protein
VPTNIRLKLIEIRTTIAPWTTASVALVGSRRPRRGLRSERTDPLPAQLEGGSMLGAQRNIRRTLALGALCSVSLAATLVQASPAAASSPLSWSAPVLVDNPPFGGMSGVSCPSASLCVAVDGSGRALIYNGSSWSAPTGIDGTNGPRSVSCPSASFCAAVDAKGNALTYNGSSWSAPASIDSKASFSSVSCPSASFCAAVDFNGNALTYNGSSWSAPSSIGGGALSSVSCPAASFCAAVDFGGKALTYNGSSWSAPVSIDGTTELRSVSCASASFCVAVDGAGKALTYTGSSWSAPVSIDGTTELRSVSCASASFCVAVDAGNAVVGTSTSAPVNAVLPVIFGSAQVGQTLSCSQGTWSGSTPQSYSYQWQADGTSIGGATSSTYVVQAADQGHTLTCEVTATNSAGHQAATSAGTAIPPATSSSGGGGGGAGQGAGSAGSTQAAVAGSITALSGGVSVPLHCSATSGSCPPVTLQLVVVEQLRNGRVIAVGARHKSKTKKRTVVIGSSTVTLSAGQSQTVKVSLNSAGKKLAAQHKKITALLQITSQGQTLKSQNVTITQTTHRAKRKHK